MKDLAFNNADPFTKKISWLRGRIIEETIKIERAIDMIILHYFAENDSTVRKKIYRVLLEEASYPKKRQYFQKVIAEFKKQHAEIKLNKSNFYTPLGKIIQQRNRMAHSQWKFINHKGILLSKKYDDDPWFTDEQIKEFIKNWDIVYGKLQYIIKKIGVLNYLEK